MSLLNILGKTAVYLKKSRLESRLAGKTAGPTNLHENDGVFIRVYSREFAAIVWSYSPTRLERSINR